MKIKKRSVEKEHKYTFWKIFVPSVSVIIAAVIGLYKSNSTSPSQTIQVRNNQNSPMASNIHTQNNYYLKDSDNLNKNSLKFNQEVNNKPLIDDSKFISLDKSRQNEFDRKEYNKKEAEMEISIQLKIDDGGYKSIELDGQNAKILPTSTPTNPRIYVLSNSNKLQTIMIITNNGDTCILKRVFDKSNFNDFPIRFIPNYKTRS